MEASKEVGIFNYLIMENKKYWIFYERVLEGVFIWELYKIRFWIFLFYDIYKQKIRSQNVRKEKEICFDIQENVYNLV